MAVFAASLRPAFLPGTDCPASSWGKQCVGRKQAGPPPHIPCKAAPVLCWPCHLLPDWHEARLGASGTQQGIGLGHRPGPGPRPQGRETEWYPTLTSIECSIYSPQPWGCMYYYLPLTNKEIKAQKIKVMIAWPRDCFLGSRNSAKHFANVNLFKSHKNSGYDTRPIFVEETESKRGEGTRLGHA